MPPTSKSGNAAPAPNGIASASGGGRVVPSVGRAARFFCGESCMTASRTPRRCASRSNRMLEALESRVLMSSAPVVPAGTASISGTVFNDVNVNGTFDAGDKGLSGRKVYIDANNNGRLDKGEIFARSKHGTYTLSGLAAGTYTVREVLPRAH